MMKILSWPVLLIATGLLCVGVESASIAQAAPTTASDALPSPATGPANAASALVQKYLDARLTGNAQAAYALLTKASLKDMPATADDRNQAIKSVTDLTPTVQAPSLLTAFAAMFLDFTNSMNYKIRLLGPTVDNPHVVLVRAYKVGTALSSAQILKVPTAPDPAAGGAARIDFEAILPTLMNDPSVAPARDKARQIASESNLKQIALAIIMYVQDHHDTLPDADKWVDEILPYVKAEGLFRDPSVPAGEKWSYAYNQTLSGISMSKLPNPAQTVLVFESTAGTKNAADTGQSLPKPGRHQGTSDFAFADGHVKALPDAAAPAFALNGAP